jgi:mono/diheme cytochrome c family protein
MSGSRNFVRLIVQLSILILLASQYPRIGFSENFREETGNPREGQRLFISKGCLHCHSVWGTAHRRGPNLAAVGMGRNLFDVAAAVWSHWPRMEAAMKPQKQAPIVLTSDEIQDIVSYLYFLNYYREPGDEEAGLMIFRDRNCQQCHATAPRLKEGKPGPAVYEMTDFEGPVSLAVALWNHGRKMYQTMSNRNVAWPVLTGKDVAYLVSYIRPQHDIAVTEEQFPGDAAHGRELFLSRSCAKCHEPKADGSRIGPDLATVGTPESVSTLVANLWNHYPKMLQAISASGISQTPMTTIEMEDLIAYIYWLRANRLKGDPAAGETLFQTKHCATCHSQTAQGMPVAPLLVGNESTRSPYSMLAAIWNHGPKMEALLRQRKMEWPSLTGEEMRDLVVFLNQGSRNKKEEGSPNSLP